MYRSNNTMKRARFECRCQTRRVWRVLIVVVVLQLTCAAVTRAIYISGKECQRADNAHR